MKAVLLIALPLLGLAAAPGEVELVNHQPFPIRQPVTVGDVSFIAAVPPNGRSRVALPQAASDRLLEANPVGGALALVYRGLPAGRLSWGLIVRRAADAPINHAADLALLKMSIKRVAATPLFTSWEASAQESGIAIMVRVRVYYDGFLDHAVSIENVSASEAYGMYVAAVTRWEGAKFGRRLLCYDNRAEDLDSSGRTRFSAGDGRHWALQHGVDWLALELGNASALVLNAYSESLTTLDDRQNLRSKSPRFTGLNIPQFKNEVQLAHQAFHLITEFVRDNRPYRDRFIENRMPERGVILTNEQRIVFSPGFPAREDADHAFLAYNGYRSLVMEGSKATLEFGLPGTVFGTSYFPYSTLGENFGELKLPGQEVDAFWPLSADTVTRWREFAGDIRRDLRIAKSMGLEVIRLHYVDVIAKLPEQIQYEYLDFLFGELRRLHLRAMFSTAFTYWTPEQIAARVARYKDVIDRVELENEILIWGIPLDRPQYWSRIYHEVKRAAPNVQVHLTAHLNAGIFTRLDALRVKADAVSAHAYIDSLDAIPSGRGFALAIASYAARRNQRALYTEWNWRGLTRMTPDARAVVYPPIFENLLATRSIHELYQFQFQQTLCVNPHTRRGIRQYEPLWLSRRPKPEAFKLMELIERYSYPDAPARRLRVSHSVVDTKRGEGEGIFRLENLSPRPMLLKIEVEAPPEVDLRAPATVSVPARGVAEIRFTVRVSPEAPPGFYHSFLRLSGEAGFLRYAWAEVRKPGQPEGADINFDRPVAVVYRENAPNIEMEAAYMLAATIESASGRPVQLFSSQDVPPGLASSVFVLEVNPDYEASVRLVLSYWMKAKDSAARRVGLVKKKLPAGVDVSALP